MVDVIRREFQLDDKWQVNNLEECLIKNDYVIRVRRTINRYSNEEYDFFYTLDYDIGRLTLLKIAGKKIIISMILI